MLKNLLLPIAAAATVLAAGISLAQAADAYKAPAQTPFDVMVTLGVTSDYIAHGASQTDHGPALQGGLELNYDQFYAGLWASNVVFTNGDSLETDWSFGWRPMVGPISLDLGYVRYLYESSGSNFGEGYLKGTINPSKALTLGAQLFVNPASSDTYIEGNLAYALPSNFKISGAIGAVNSASSYTTWNAGLSWALNDSITLDARYWDASAGCFDTVGNACGARIVGSVSISSSFKKLGLLR